MNNNLTGENSPTKAKYIYILIHCERIIIILNQSKRNDHFHIISTWIYNDNKIWKAEISNARNIKFEERDRTLQWLHCIFILYRIHTAHFSTTCVTQDYIFSIQLDCQLVIPYSNIPVRLCPFQPHLFYTPENAHILFLKICFCRPLPVSCYNLYLLVYSINDTVR